MKVEDVTVIPTGGCHDCGGRCVLKVHVKNGVAIRVESDNGEEPQLRACARGRAYRKRVYDPNRLKYPMKRVGARGEGKFERVSWDVALDTIAKELTRVKETYGPQAILGVGVSGHVGSVFQGDHTLHRFFNMFGGFVRTWGGASAEGSTFASRCVYGTMSTGHTRDDLINSRLIIMWGWNPVTTIQSTNTSFYLLKAKEKGAKIICIDPRFTDSAAILAHQWIPIRPGTDTALMVAIAYVMLRENIQDQKFLDKYTTGFDKFKEYLMGVEDGVPKTPSWAEAITSVPADIIENLAREYATTKPAALIAGYAPGRTAYGEEYHRAAATLAAITGNIGIHGGGAAGFERGPLGVMIGPGLPEGKNPLETSLPSVRGSLDAALRNRTRIHTCQTWDAILKGKAGGYPGDPKLLYVVATNTLNQFPNVNKGIQALGKLDFIVVHEQFMTPTAKFADVLLPVVTNWERNELARPWLSGPYYIYMNKVIDTMHEAKSDFEIFGELATRLGFKYSDKTWDGWIDEVLKTSPDMSKDIPDHEAFKRDGVYKFKLDKSQICFNKQIEAPEANPFPTPSGKIEIYSQRLAELNNPKLPPVPKYIETWESVNDPLAKRYPLQLITIHFLTRAHSNFDNTTWLKQLEAQTVWLNSVDAQSRDIGDGDEVKVFNARGEVILLAKVTERIMPGVVAIGEGAWYRPDQTGADRGGCPNVLTKDDYSPGGAWPLNTSLVEVRKEG